MGQVAYFRRQRLLRGHAAPGDAPRGARLEERGRVDLVGPAEEMRPRLVGRRAEYGGPACCTHAALERLAALQRIDARLRLLGDRPFLAPARHPTNVAISG